MGTDGKTFLHDLPASVAGLRRETSGNLYHLMTSPLSLISQDGDKHSPGRIGNALCQRMIVEHAGDIQVFYADALIACCVGLGSLEEKVPTLALDFEMRLGAVAGRFAASLAPLLATAELALFAPQGSLTLAIIARIGNRRAVGISQEDFQADIQPNVRMDTRASRLLLVALCWWLTDNQRVPVPISPQDQMTRLGGALYRAMQLDFEQQTHFAGDTEMLAIFMQAEVLPMLAQLNRVPSVGLFEAREATGQALFFAREIPPECFIQPISKHLDGGGRNRLTATSGKARGQFIFEEKPTHLGILRLGRFQHLIIEVARLDQAGHQLLALLPIRIETIFNRSHALTIALEQPCCQE